MSVELVKATEDTSVRYGLVAWSPKLGFGDNWGLINQDLLIGGVQRGEYFKLGLRIEWERGTGFGLLRVISGSVTLEVLATFAIAERSLVPFLSLGPLVTLGNILRRVGVTPRIGAWNRRGI